MKNTSRKALPCIIYVNNPINGHFVKLKSSNQLSQQQQIPPLTTTAISTRLTYESDTYILQENSTLTDTKRSKDERTQQQ